MLVSDNKITERIVCEVGVSTACFPDKRLDFGVACSSNAQPAALMGIPAGKMGAIRDGRLQLWAGLYTVLTYQLNLAISVEASKVFFTP